jgi:sugar lactone lactonase YvrE
MPSDIGAFLPREDGRWVALLADGAYLFDEVESSLERLALFPHSLGPLEGSARMRANDAEVSPEGIVVAGTMPYDTHAYPGSGSLFVLNSDTFSPLVDDVTISNGIGWSADHSQMLYIDTPTNRVDVFDWSSAGTLGLSNRRVFAEVDESLGWPDGLSIDKAGYVWVAMWGGSRVQRFAPDGSLAGYVEIPCVNVTSCAFVGENLMQLVITTSNIDHESDQAAGKTYMFDVTVPGLPTARAKA